MITVRLLGTLDIRDAGGDELSTLLRQPKRVALLSYLAVAQPRGFHRRDTLMGLFWPESTQDQARNALSQALHVLRQELGEGAIVTRGEGEVALSEDVVSVDVRDLDAAFAGGEYERVVELYGGPLLSGFSVKASAEFDQWLDGARDRLARAYTDSMERLAEAAAERGEQHEAVEWWRRLVQQDPYSTHVTLCLMRALEAAGDRAGALEQAERHAALLQSELSAEPSPDVVAYAEQLRRDPVRHVGDSSLGGPAAGAAQYLERVRRALADRYAVEREIGSGGMAMVFLARDLKHERQVAVKVLRPELAASLGADRFLREIKITANLSHPHILPLLDSGRTGASSAVPTFRRSDEFLYYVMPYVAGESLRDRLNRERQLPIDESLKIASEVADALGYAHGHKVIHRDIKPENILLEAKHAVVADFGVARAIEEAGEDGITGTGKAVGTPAYMSPEQATGDSELDGRSDLYSLGCVLYEMLAGEPPFTGASVEYVIRKQISAVVTPVSVVRPNVPEALSRLVERLLAKATVDRYQTANELAQALAAEQARAATPDGGVMPSDKVTVERMAKRRWTIAGAAIAVAAITAVIAAVVTIRGGGVLRLERSHVVVAVFRNATGDASLDKVGERAAHWITQGLQQAAMQVTPWDGALQAWQYVQSEVEEGRVHDATRALAEETGAGTVVSGVVYLENDSLEIHVDVTDVVRGRPLGTVSPVRGPRTSVTELIADAQQRLMGFLAMNSDERIGPQASSLTQPPSYEAYRAFDDGLEHYLRDDFPAALPHFYQAFGLDTTFVTPLIYAILSNLNLALNYGRRDAWPKADSLLGILDRFSGRLSEYDQAWLDYLKARMAGDNPEALRAIRRAAELAPGSKAVYNRAVVALAVNRPREALDALLSLDPEHGPMRGFLTYHGYLQWAYVALGENERAMEAGRQSREMYGEALGIWYEGLGLALMGRVEEVGAVVDDLVSLPDQGLAPGTWITSIAGVLRRRGYIDAAGTTVDRVLGWYETRQPETKSSAVWRLSYAAALYVADRCNEAYAVLKPPSAELPREFNYRGWVGVVAACQGDREEALGISNWLATVNVPHSMGEPAMLRAMIAGTLGDGENAVAFFRQALAEGYFPYPQLLIWIAFESLRDYSPFQELIRPKG